MSKYFYVFLVVGCLFWLFKHAIMLVHVDFVTLMLIFGFGYLYFTKK